MTAETEDQIKNLLLVTDLPFPSLYPSYILFGLQDSRNCSKNNFFFGFLISSVLPGPPPSDCNYVILIKKMSIEYVV